MAKKAKSSRKKSNTLLKLVENDSHRRNLLFIPFISLVFKLILIARIGPVAWPGIDPEKYRLANFWMGADGENYVTGLNALVRDGFFSTEGILNYWPAGYPILLYVFGLPFRSWTLVSMGIIQTLIYALATAYFVDSLAKTRLKRFALPVALILAFNPTLSFNTYSVGYETWVASLVLVAVALMVRDFKAKKSGVVSKEAVFAALLISLSSFTQPRMIVTGLVLFIVWGLATRRKKNAAVFLSVAMILSLLFPALLVARNIVATDQPSMSSNLGVNMRIGAGPSATGSYGTGSSDLVCPTVEGTASEQDNAVVKCVIRWYLDNPSEAPLLFAKKALYFWSPWFGPLAMGTMARSPWTQNHPLKSTASTQEGFDLIYGGPGKVISWLWVIGSLIFLGLGFVVLWRMGGVERLLGIAILLILLVNIGVALATFGDHRFRLPTAGLSLFLQVVGIMWAFSKGKKKAFYAKEPLLWKSFQRTTNLQP